MSDSKLKPCPLCQSPHVCIMLSPQQEDGSRFFYGFCYECSAEAGEGDTEAQAAEAWNSLPRHLQWTTELPTEEGWYWWCGDKRRIPTIGRIGYQGSKADGLFTMPPMRSFVESFPITAVGGFWAGPIPEPQAEPQEVRK